MNDFQLDLQLVHRFGLVTPRPHATIVGSVFQDLDYDNQQDAD